MILFSEDNDFRVLISFQVSYHKSDKTKDASWIVHLSSGYSAVHINIYNLSCLSLTVIRLILQLQLFKMSIIAQFFAQNYSIFSSVFIEVDYIHRDMNAMVYWSWLILVLKIWLGIPLPTPCSVTSRWLKITIVGILTMWEMITGFSQYSFPFPQGAVR